MKTNEWLAQLKPGDVVMRMLCGVIPMLLRVSAIGEDRIVCGAWEFRKDNGGEIDEDLHLPGGVYASFIREPTPKEISEAGKKEPAVE